MSALSKFHSTRLNIQELLSGRIRLQRYGQIHAAGGAVFVGVCISGGAVPAAAAADPIATAAITANTNFFIILLFLNCEYYCLLILLLKLICE